MSAKSKKWVEDLSCFDSVSLKMSSKSIEYKTVVNCMNELEIALAGDREVVYFLFKEGFINNVFVVIY